MKKSIMLLLGAAAIATPVFAAEPSDSASLGGGKEMDLDELVVVARRQSVKQDPGRIVYLIKNDPYAVGLNGMELLDRIPRVSVVNDQVSVAGKNEVRYIVDGQLLEMTGEALSMRLRNLQADGIEKIELLTTPPARYAAGNNTAFISITTRNETLGARGNVWGRGRYSDSFGYSFGGNVCHTSRKTELSVDAGWNDRRGKNDTYSEYRFADHLQVSDRNHRFTWRTLGANGMFRYRFNPGLSAGVMVNFSRNLSKSDRYDRTSVGSTVMLSESVTPMYPEDALTLTGFVDWNIDPAGKTLSLTYNLFDKRSDALSDVITAWNTDETSRLTRDASNRYRIHSVKLDAALPFSGFKMEAGLAYTSIGNRTRLGIADEIDGEMVDNPLQSNDFVYHERTASAYLTAERNFASGIYGKIGLRYEHTYGRGSQKEDTGHHATDYGNLFPSAIVSWSIPSGGRLSADYSAGIARPSFGDMNPFRYYNTVKDYFTGNPDLRAVLSHTTQASITATGAFTR
ncbi:MAG: TonB-dependent receptor [Bacteroides sp.]|nr:TonB-dependent receptor [Bacteroides sp.]